MIHTHPYATDEEMWACLNVPQSIIDLDPDIFGELVETYNNKPSQGDIDFLEDLFENGIEIEGYIIDDNGIIGYNKDINLDDLIDFHTRCAY